MEDGARDKNELYSLITHLKIGRDQFISSLKLKTWLFKRCNLQTVPQRQTQFSLYSSHKRLTFRVVHTELSWTRYFGVYCTVFASDFMVSLLIVSRALPVSTSFGSSGHFLHLYCRHPEGYFSELPFERKVFFNEVQIGLRLTSMLRVASITEVSSVQYNILPCRILSRGCEQRATD